MKLPSLIFNSSDHSILLNGERITNIRCADDTVVFADSPIGFHEFRVNIINGVREQYSLKMNRGKTKFMITSTQDIQKGNERKLRTFEKEIWCARFLDACETEYPNSTK